MALSAGRGGCGFGWEADGVWPGEGELAGRSGVECVPREPDAVWVGLFWRCSASERGAAADSGRRGCRAEL